MRKRILKFLELKRLSRLSFYKPTGLSSGFQDKEAEIMEASLRKIANSFQDLNIDWVRTGEGEIIIHGNSMSPKYLEGSRVALKRYPFSPANPLGIQFGKVYAVAVGQGDCYPLLHFIKRLHRHPDKAKERTTYIARSISPDYDDFEVSVLDISPSKDSPWIPKRK